MSCSRSVLTGNGGRVEGEAPRASTGRDRTDRPRSDLHTVLGTAVEEVYGHVRRRQVAVVVHCDFDLQRLRRRRGHVTDLDVVGPESQIR